MNTPFTGTKQALPAKIDLILWTQQEKVTTPLKVSYFSNCSLNNKFGAKSYPSLMGAAFDFDASQDPSEQAWMEIVIE